MYKQIGFEFQNLAEDQAKYLKQAIARIMDFYKSLNKDNVVSEPTNKRTNHRVRIIPDLPDELVVNIWFLFENRFHKCVVKDLSETGAGVVMPFMDRYDFFNKDRPFTAMIDFGKSKTNYSFTCRSIIKYNRNLDPPENLRSVLVELDKQIHESERGLVEIEAPRVIDYGNLSFTKTSSYKRFGLSLQLDKQAKELMHKYMAGLVIAHKKQNPNFEVDKVNRQSFRLPVDNTTPQEFQVEIWIKYGGALVKCSVFDISVDGASVTFPIAEPHLEKGNMVELILITKEFETQCTAAIRQETRARLSPNLKKKLEELRNCEYKKAV